MNSTSKTLIKMMLPAVFGLMMTFLFQLVDSYFVGRLGADALTAIGFTYPIYIMIISIFVGLSIGIGAVIGKRFGQEDDKGVRESSFAALILSTVMALLVIGLVYVNRLSLYSLLGVEERLWTLVDDYLAILLLGMPLILVSMNMIAVLRGVGKGLVPEIIMGVGGMVNLVLDYLLIFGIGIFPRLAIKGAAIATVISWFVIGVLITGILLKNRLLTLRTRRLFINLREIIKVALPAVLNNVIVPISILILTRIIAGISSGAVAAYGVSSKIESLLLTIIMALSMVLVPIMANKHGAKDQIAMDKLIALSGKIAVYWSILVFLLMLMLSENIAKLFTQNVNLIVYIKNYALVVSASFAFSSLGLVTIAIFNGIGLERKALMVTIIKYLGFLLPLALIAGQVSYEAVILAISLSNLFGGLYAMKNFKKWQRESKSNLLNENILDDYKADLKSLLHLVR